MPLKLIGYWYSRYEPQWRLVRKPFTHSNGAARGLKRPAQAVKLVGQPLCGAAIGRDLVPDSSDCSRGRCNHVAGFVGGLIFLLFYVKAMGGTYEWHAKYRDVGVEVPTPT